MFEFVLVQYINLALHPFISLGSLFNASSLILSGIPKNASAIAPAIADVVSQSPPIDIVVLIVSSKLSLIKKQYNASGTESWHVALNL